MLKITCNNFTKKILLLNFILCGMAMCNVEILATYNEGCSRQVIKDDNGIIKVVDITDGSNCKSFFSVRTTIMNGQPVPCFWGTNEDGWSLVFIDGKIRPISDQIVTGKHYSSISEWKTQQNIEKMTVASFLLSVLVLGFCRDEMPI
jgi:hypothetical protein